MKHFDRFLDKISMPCEKNGSEIQEAALKGLASLMKEEGISNPEQALKTVKDQHTPPVEKIIQSKRNNTTP